MLEFLKACNLVFDAFQLKADERLELYAEGMRIIEYIDVNFEPRKKEYRVKISNPSKYSILIPLLYNIAFYRIVSTNKYFQSECVLVRDEAVITFTETQTTHRGATQRLMFTRK